MNAQTGAGRPSPRLLPWDTEGKAAFLITDPNTTSPLAQLADRMEEAQLQAAGQVYQLSGRPEVAEAPDTQLRWIIEQLRAALSDVLRVAQSRGMRVPERDSGDGDDSEWDVDDHEPDVDLRTP